MGTISDSIENNHKRIISSLILVIFFMATSCVFHNVIPICHKIFGCDHKMHETTSH